MQAKDIKFQLTKTPLLSFGCKLQWKVSDLTDTQARTHFTVQQAAADQAVLLKKSDGSTITSMKSPAVTGAKVSFELDNKAYT